MEMDITGKTGIKIGSIPVGEVRRKRVKPIGNSGHVVVPNTWIGKEIIIILPAEEDKNGP
jgi:putative transposon-encoded protein